jgi:hypothetical protein
VHHFLPKCNTSLNGTINYAPEKRKPDEENIGDELLPFGVQRCHVEFQFAEIQNVERHITEKVQRNILPTVILQKWGYRFIVLTPF